jgi:uncharacterized protein (DUF4415 family)
MRKCDGSAMRPRRSSYFDASSSARCVGAPTKEHPEAEVKHIVRGIVRKGLKPVPSKALVSLRQDQDVLEWFKSQGAGYQTRMNAVLRAFRDASG